MKNISTFAHQKNEDSTPNITIAYYQKLILVKHKVRIADIRLKDNKYGAINIDDGSVSKSTKAANQLN